MDRRTFLERTAVAAAGLGVTGCLPRAAIAPSPGGPPLVRPDISWDRVIRTTVGLRPHRPSGFVVRADKLDDKMLIHNFGHGGAGMSLSWGTAFLAQELASAQPARRAAVIGCGVAGLTTARQLQRHGFDVTIYAKALPPDTTSNMSFAAFTPTSGLFAPDRRTPAWDAQFRRAAEIAYRELQLLAGARYGISWIDDYATMAERPASLRGVLGMAPGDSSLVTGISVGRTVLGPGEHPFASRYATRGPLLRFEPSIYLDALMRDVLAFGGRIVVRSFDTPRDLAALPEPVLVNCTGLGAKALFGDDELIPVKGQLTVLVPQSQVTYSAGGMMPRTDGIVLGHVQQRGVWSLDVDEAARARVVDAAIAFFSGMRRPAVAMHRSGVARTTVASAPPLESFFGLES